MPTRPSERRPGERGATLVHMANATLGMGQPVKARSYLDQALPIGRQLGEKWLISFILNNYGEVARTAGDYKNAKIYYEESERLLRAMGDKGDLARLVHTPTWLATHAERAVSRGLGGSCSMPLAAHARWNGNALQLDVALGHGADPGR
mgnify:CR=1 FL=1